MTRIILSPVGADSIQNEILAIHTAEEADSSTESSQPYCGAEELGLNHGQICFVQDAIPGNNKKWLLASLCGY